MTADTRPDLTPEVFAGLSERTFELISDEVQGVSLDFREANALRGDSDAREPFSIIFMGPHQPILPQAIRRLRHPDLGVLDLFLVPVGPDKDNTGIQYEAIFS